MGRALGGAVAGEKPYFVEDKVRNPGIDYSPISLARMIMVTWENAKAKAPSTAKIG